jgi:hypothetical protein
LRNANFIRWHYQFWYGRSCNCPSRWDVEECRVYLLA